MPIYVQIPVEVILKCLSRSLLNLYKSVSFRSDTPVHERCPENIWHLSSIVLIFFTREIGNIIVCIYKGYLVVFWRSCCLPVFLGDKLGHPINLLLRRQSLHCPSHHVPQTAKRAAQLLTLFRVNRNRISSRVTQLNASTTASKSFSVSQEALNQDTGGLLELQQLHDHHVYVLLPRELMVTLG